MNKYENNAYFWQKLDTLYLSSKLVIDRPRNSCHYKYSNLIYPVDYGYLTETINADQAPIDVFKGSKKEHLVNVVAIAADILKKDVEVKLLIGCTPEEERSILEFLNQTDFQKCVLIRRGNEVPEWSSKD
ncbi:MAG: inorganic diphosphatase [Erysipelotrichaceae bacterium]